MSKIVIEVPGTLQEKLEALQAEVGYKISLETAIHAAVEMVIDDPEYKGEIIEQHEYRKQKFGQRGRPKKVA